VAAQLPRWNWVNSLYLVPRRIRDSFYNIIARNRYHIFGRYDACDLAPAGFANRIIVDAPRSGERNL